MSDPDSGAPIGYLPQWSYKPGDVVNVHVWCQEPWRADFVRVHSGDPRPNGPGLQETTVTAGSDAQKPCTTFTLPGSMAWAPVRTLPSRVALVAWIRPTRLGANGHSVLSAQRRDGSTMWGLGVSPHGRWQLLGSSMPVDAGSAAVGKWHLTQLIVDTATGRIRLQILRDGFAVTTGDAELSLGREQVVRLAIGGSLPPSGSRVATDCYVTFDGLIAEPCLIKHPLASDEMDAVLAGARIDECELLARWIFPTAVPPEVVGPASVRPVQLRNTPASGMPGPYGELDALHCHSDDVTDAEWPVGIQIGLPDDAPSGIYAVRLRSARGIDRIPLVVRQAGIPHAQALLILPTMTYLAYANEMQPSPDNYLAKWAYRARPGALDRWLERHPEFGYSVYDRHADGSGVNYSSLRRPIPNIRPDYLHWLSGEPRHLGADLFISNWLDRSGITYDVACDHDLDEQGIELLAPYSVILTGSHPEYSTGRMLDALESYLKRSGKLMYLGGNGFYWVTSTSTSDPTTIEVRRGPRGYPWRSEERASIHAFDGQSGGLWADNGRPQRQLVGVTFIAMGLEEPAPGYHANSGLPEEYSWVFEGVDGDVIGTQGLLMGGAAGHEIDCVIDKQDGIVLLASSTGHSARLALAPDLADSRRPAPPIPHADLVLYERPNGGQVLSTGSICWSGALAEPGGDRSVQRVTRNVMYRFLASVGEPAPQREYAEKGTRAGVASASQI